MAGSFSTNSSPSASAKKVTVYIVSSPISTEDHERARRYSAVSKFYVKPISQDNLAGMLQEMQEYTDWHFIVPFYRSGIKIAGSMALRLLNMFKFDRPGLIKSIVISF